MHIIYIILNKYNIHKITKLLNKVQKTILCKIEILKCS